MSESQQANPPLGADGPVPTPAPEPAPADDAQTSQATPRPQKGNPPGADLRQRLDQVGSILAKGLDLAEAGVSLGVTIISRVGVAAQQKIREGMDAAASPGAAPAGPGSGLSPEAEQSSHPGSPASEPEPTYGITNRLPLVPGGNVRISFSVNNDSMTEPKKVELRIDGFTGDTHGAPLDPSTFTVTPAQKTIAPVDFDKFIIQGTVPATALADVYRGAVIVASGNELKIPLVLIVMPL
jgi:hypothetical protein